MRSGADWKRNTYPNGMRVLSGTKKTSDNSSSMIQFRFSMRMWKKHTTGWEGSGNSNMEVMDEWYQRWLKRKKGELKKISSEYDASVQWGGFSGEKQGQRCWCQSTARLETPCRDWRTSLKTLEKVFWNFCENQWAQNPKPPQAGFL